MWILIINWFYCFHDLFLFPDETFSSSRCVSAHLPLPHPPLLHPMDSHIIPSLLLYPSAHSGCTWAGVSLGAPPGCSGGPWHHGNVAPGFPASSPGAWGWREWVVGGGGGAAESPERGSGGPAAVTLPWGSVAGEHTLSGRRRGGGWGEKERSSYLHRWRTPGCEPGERRIRFPLREEKVDRPGQWDWWGGGVSRAVERERHSETF